MMERREFLDPRKNPVFEYARVQPFLAMRDGQVVGTIAAVDNDRYGQFHSDERHVGFFGLYECIEDQTVADALFAAASAWLQDKGKSVLRGPVNLTTNDVVGLLVEGFDEDPTLMMPYNPPYYAPQLETAGFTKTKDLYAFALSGKDYMVRLKPATARLMDKAAFSIRPFDLAKWEEELEFVRSTYNTAWAENWGFVPWTDAELAFVAKELKPLVDPRLTFMGEIGGVRAGFIIAVPDANEALKLAKGKLFPTGLLRILWKLKVSKCKRLRTIAMGVLPEYRNQGLDAFLVHNLAINSERLGYWGSEMGWILEDNKAMLSALRRIQAERTKTYRVYDRPV